LIDFLSLIVFGLNVTGAQDDDLTPDIPELLPIMPAIPGQEVRFKYLTTEDGLTTNQVFDILKTRRWLPQPWLWFMGTVRRLLTP